MKFKIAFAFLSLVFIRFFDMCEISGEKCVCIKDMMTTEMSCLEKPSNPKILNLNEIVIYGNAANLKIYIENEIYDGINKSSYGKFLAKINELWINNNQIKKLESNTFLALIYLKIFVLISNGIEGIEKIVDKKEDIVVVDLLVVETEAVDGIEAFFLVRI